MDARKIEDVLYDRDMEDSRQLLAVSLLRDRQTSLLLRFGMVMAVFASIVLLFLTVAGYGHAKLIGIPANATVSINGHHVTATTLKMRPGSYQVLIFSPTLTPYQGTLHVGLLTTTQYKPSLSQRSPDAIASSILGAIPGSTLPPKFEKMLWFSDNTWLAGSLTPDDTVLALHYDGEQKQWVLAFCSATGYPNDTSVLPSSVASYVQSLIEAQRDA